MKFPRSQFFAGLAVLLLLLPGTGRADDAAALQVQAAALAQLPIRNAAGDRLDLQTHPGKILLVDFWAWWCPNCLAEMAGLAKLQNDLGPDRIEIVLVSGLANWPKDQAYAAAHELPFPRYVAGVALPATIAAAVKGKVLADGQIENTLPLAAVFAPDGRLTDSRLGAQDWSDPVMEQGLLTAAGVKHAEIQPAD